MYADRVQETTTSTGTGNITLAGAASGMRTFNAAFGVGPHFAYCIAGGSEWEVGLGYLSNSTTLVRGIVLSSSNSGNAVNFSAGTKDVFNTAPAISVGLGANAAAVPAVRLHFGV